MLFGVGAQTENKFKYFAIVTNRRVGFLYHILEIQIQLNI